MGPAQRHHAVGVIAAARRARGEVGGVMPFVCRHTTQAPQTIISGGLGDRTAQAARLSLPPTEFRARRACRVAAAAGYRYQARGPDVLRERCVAGFAVAFTTRAGTTSPMRAGATRMVDPNQTRSLEAAVSRVTWTSAEATSGGDAALGAPGLPLGGQSARSTLVSHGGPIALIVTHTNRGHDGQTGRERFGLHPGGCACSGPPCCSAMHAEARTPSR
jgi:hypothetical protein